MASPPATPTVPTAIIGNPVSQQLSSVSAMLETTVQQMTTDVVACPADADTSPQSSRGELSAQIKALEAALAQLPEGPLLSATRDSLTAEIARTKKLITELRPVGARLDACREALQRASTRQAQLQETARLTHSALQASETEVQRLTLELSSLEAAVAKQEKSPNCLDQLKVGMESVITEMVAGGAVKDDILAEARGHMAKLFDGLTTISLSCRAASSGSSPSAPALLQAQPGAKSCLQMLQANAAAQAAERAA